MLGGAEVHDGRAPGRGPQGGPGIRGVLAITGAIKGAGLGSQVLLVPDGRFSGGTTGLCVGHLPGTMV